MPELGNWVGVRLKDDVVETDRALRTDPWPGSGGIVPADTPFRVELLEGILVEGKEDKEAWRLTPLELAVVPLVDGR